MLINPKYNCLIKNVLNQGLFLRDIEVETREAYFCFTYFKYGKSGLLIADKNGLLLFAPSSLRNLEDPTTNFRKLSSLSEAIKLCRRELSLELAVDEWLENEYINHTVTVLKDDILILKRLKSLRSREKRWKKILCD